MRERCSPRHVPDEVFQIAEVPRTLSGKVLEVPVKRILMGTPAEQAASRDSLANPAALDYFTEMAARLDDLSRPRGARRRSIARSARQHREAPAGGDEDAAEHVAREVPGEDHAPSRPTAATKQAPEQRRRPAASRGGTTKAKAIAIEAAAVAWPLGKAIGSSWSAPSTSWKRGMGEQRP